MTDMVLGIDAGGTSVRASLAWRDGNPAGGKPLASARVDAAPDGGPEILSALFSALCTNADASLSDIRAACAGITKFTRAGIAERWERELERLLLSAETVSVVADFVIAFHGAIPQGSGVAVIAGTGSVVYGENPAGKAVRIGGRGWEYGDEGSGAWLTTEVVRRTLRSLDGLAEPTPLTRAVCTLLDTEEPSALGEAARQRAFAEGRGFLVPLILQHAQNREDAEARNLFVGAGGWLAAQVRAAAARLEFRPESELPVAMIGGLWEADALLREPFQAALKRWYPAAHVFLPDAPPVVGAIRFARRVDAWPH